MCTELKTINAFSLFAFVISSSLVQNGEFSPMWSLTFGIVYSNLLQCSFGLNTEFNKLLLIGSKYLIINETGTLDIFLHVLILSTLISNLLSTAIENIRPNDDESPEKFLQYNRYMKKARESAEAGRPKESLEYLKKAAAIQRTEKVLKRIEKVEVRQQTAVNCKLNCKLYLKYILHLFICVFFSSIFIYQILVKIFSPFCIYANHPQHAIV